MPKPFLFALPMLAAMFLVVVLRDHAHKFDLLDHPNQRKVHKGSVPLVGGLAMTITFALGAVLLGYGHALPWGFFVAAAVLVALGLHDDRRPLPAIPRFAVQTLAISASLYASDLYLHELGNLFGFGLVTLGVWAVPFTVFGILGVTNAVNLSDGADGLAGGLAFTALFWFGIVYAVAAKEGGLPAGVPDLLPALLALAGAVCGFLAFNLRAPWRERAAVFMGDGGSLFLGFVLGWFAVVCVVGLGPKGLKPVSALWILIVPLFDTVSCMVRRVLQGRSPMSADRRHVHHLLRKMGLPVVGAVPVLLAANMLGGFVGVTGWRLGWPDHWMFWSYAALFVAYTVFALSSWRVIETRGSGMPRLTVRPVAERGARHAMGEPS
jgi:UDP-GlcNAc:undecaprenyl-phosphate GlcNAc-1-phosphate transferase